MRRSCATATGRPSCASMTSTTPSSFRSRRRMTSQIHPTSSYRSHLALSATHVRTARIDIPELVYDSARSHGRPPFFN